MGLLLISRIGRGLEVAKKTNDSIIMWFVGSVNELTVSIDNIDKVMAR